MKIIKKKPAWGNISCHALKMLMIMKLTVCLFLVSALGVLANSSYAQKTKLTLNFKETPLEQVLSSIEDQSEFYFLYSKKVVDVERKVNIEVTEEIVPNILDLLLSNSNETYIINGRQIVLTVPGDSWSPSSSYNSAIMQQQSVVGGKITDSAGIPLPGVTVIVKGTTQGTITDVEGNYSISNIPAGATLVFSFVGMRTQEVTVDNKTTIDITMKEDIIGLEEVVAVGYGTQKKINITGSITSVTNEELQGKAVSRTSLALAGEMSGISVRQASGNPGRDAGEIIVRGLGTFSIAGSSPLVIIDGIPGALDNINPNDIQSISVLKDAASAAIYGSRAANGVILVETKKGAAGVMKITYNNYFGKQIATSYVEFLDSWEYAEAFNEALQNMGNDPQYTQEDIKKFKSGEDPDNYPNKHHLKDLFSSGSGLQTRHDLILSSGNSGTQYYFSAGYLKNEGIVKYNFSDRYQLRINVNSRIRDNVQLTVNLSGDINEWEEPIGRYNNLDGIVTGAMRLPNIIPGEKTDGSYGHIETHHPEACLESGGFYRRKGSNFISNINLSWNIFKDLKVSGIMGYNFSNSYIKQFNTEYDVTPVFNVSPAKLSVTNANGSNLILDFLIDYDKSLGKHTIHFMGGTSAESHYSNSLSAFRDKFPTNLLYEINVGSVENRTNSGSATRNKLLSYFGRGNYSYLDKYLLEANVRYDGSSRFPEGRKFGLFPSFSAGWRIFQEDFFESLIISNLKLRGSWGELGNQSIGDYPYQAIISLSQNSPIGGSLASGASVNTLPNRNINWETTRVADVGLDINFFQNKLGLTVDYFSKKTFDILYNVSASAMLGATPSVENAATVENKGFDLNVVYKNSYKKFSYSIATNFTNVNNKVLEIANLDKDIGRGLFVGHPLGAYYGYVSDGLFIDENDIQNYAIQPYNALPGTIRLKDISGPDGIPDGKVTTDDRKVLGSDNPKFMYGLRFNFKYNNWDAFAVFQGEAGMLRTLNTYAFAFVNAGNIQRWIWEERWTKENPSRNARYPRLQTTGTGHLPALELVSDYWHYSGSYLRLKNLQIGYNLPNSILQKISISSLRIFVSGTNLLTFDNNQPGWDPEMELRGSASIYPPTSIYSFGFNIDF